tara:strand:- start:7668 stop:9944 length:2277 start_codon:yes stop_codon:yes gene_type:complete
MATKKVNIDIVARDKSKAALKGVRGGLDKVKKSVFNLRNAFIGLGAGMAIRSLVKTGMELESLQVRLKFLFGTAEEGAKAFDEMAKFASKVPFSLEEIQRGAGVLSVVSDDADELAKLMRITGNVAAVSGLDFKTASEQIQRSLSAGISAADLFRDRGVKDMLGFKAGAVVTAEETAEAFDRVFGEGGEFGGSTEALAKTFEGTLSMIGDKFFNFKKDILEAGFFPELKKQFGDLDKFLADNSDAIEDIAVQLGEGLAKSVVALSESVKFVADNFKILKAAVGGFIAYKLAGTVLTIASALRKMQITLVGITALSGPRGLGLVALSIGAMTTAAMLLPDPLQKSLEGFQKLTKKEVKNKIKDITDQINKLTEENAKLEKSFEDLTPEIDLPKIDDLDGLKNFKDNIIEIPDLVDGVADSMINNTNQIVALKTELDLLNQVMDAHNESALNMFPPLKPNAWIDGSLGKAVKENNEETKKLIETHGILDNDLKDLFPTLTAYKEAINKIGDAYQFVDMSLQDFLDKEKQLKMMNETGIFDEDTFDLTRVQSFMAGFKEQMAQGADAMARFKDAGKQSFDELQKTLTNFVMTGKLNFEDFARTVTRLIVDALIGSAIQSAVKKSMELFKSSAIKDALINVYGAAVRAFKNFGGWPFGVMAAGATIAVGMNLVNKMKGFEKGGRPPVGQPSIVGEAGPELFVPSSAGTIVPNNQLGGKPVTVNFNINTVDARGFNELLVNSRGVIVNMINSAVNEKGRQAII